MLKLIKIAIIIFVILVPLIICFYALIEWGWWGLLLFYFLTISFEIFAWVKWLRKSGISNLFLYIILIITTISVSFAFFCGERFGKIIVDIITKSR